MPRPREKFNLWIPIIIVFLVCEAGVYTFFHLRLVNMSYRVRQLDRQYAELDDQNRTLQFKLASLKNPKNIEEEMRRNNIDLQECTDRKTVWLEEPQVNKRAVVAEMPAQVNRKGGMLNLLRPELGAEMAAGAKK